MALNGLGVIVVYLYRKGKINYENENFEENQTVTLRKYFENKLETLPKYGKQKKNGKM